MGQRLFGERKAKTRGSKGPRQQMVAERPVLWMQTYFVGKQFPGHFDQGRDVLASGDNFEDQQLWYLVVGGSRRVPEAVGERKEPFRADHIDDFSRRSTMLDDPGVRLGFYDSDLAISKCSFWLSRIHLVQGPQPSTLIHALVILLINSAQLVEFDVNMSCLELKRRLAWSKDSISIILGFYKLIQTMRFPLIRFCNFHCNCYFNFLMMRKRENQLHDDAPDQTTPRLVSWSFDNKNGFQNQKLGNQTWCGEVYRAGFEKNH